MKDERKARKKISRTRNVVGGISLLVLGVVFGSFALGQVGNYEIVSNSMAPTLVKGDRVLVNQHLEGAVAIGDVIAFEDPRQPGEMLTKRVAATGGQTVAVVGKYLTINGKRWAAPGQRPAPVPRGIEFERVQVGEGEIFVLGDNTGQSEDSLYFGPVPAALVKGKLVVKYWPVERLGLVK